MDSDVGDAQPVRWNGRATQQPLFWNNAARKPRLALKELCPPFTAALYAAAEACRPPERPSVGEWVKKT